MSNWPVAPVEYALAAMVFMRVRAWPVILGSEPNCFLAPGAMVDRIGKQLGSDPKITAFTPVLAGVNGGTGAMRRGLNLEITAFAPAFAVVNRSEIGVGSQFHGQSPETAGRGNLRR